jgi:hypothetical protein
MRERRTGRSIMDSKIQLLIEALRSEKYVENRSNLLMRYNNQYDIYGVICDISNIGKWKIKDDITYYEINKSRWWYLLPPEVNDFIELSEKLRLTLYDMYKDGLNFADIADYLEEYWHNV